MIDYGRRDILGVQISAVDYQAAVEQIIAAARQRQALAVSALAVHGLMTGALDPQQRYRLNRLDLLTPDGQPVRWALAWLHGVHLPDRVYGPTLMLKVCERAAAEGLPVYLYGSQESTLAALCKNLKEKFPALIIAGAEPSRFRQVEPSEKKAVIKRILSSGAALVFVGLGCPRQEVWAYEYREALGIPVLAVGAAFDFHANTVPQAPPFLQRAGLEWAYRLWQEPKRLWKRYLTLNPLYLWLVFLQKFGSPQFQGNPEEAPSEELRYG